MEAEQEREWLEAQSIVISEDLVAVGKQQLQFLAVVDRNRCLYDGPVLQRAIYRYNACWLPLLAKHSESQISEGPLVVPLDCEWVWHCHRLNPVRYKLDCEQFYGRVLDNCNVVSSVQGTSKAQTEEIWNRLYPEESYDFDFTTAHLVDVSGKASDAERFTKYDLVAAVKRQIPFSYQVSRPHMSNDIFLEEAVARYKGFLYLIKRNWENFLKCFCVPTYDIDLIWHSHQLHPVSYCNDMTKTLGRVLEHDDTDSDRTKGKKLDNGFSATTKQWEEIFGTRYWRAGAMHRGNSPLPLSTSPYIPESLTTKVAASSRHEEAIELPQKKCVEILLEIVGVSNLPEGHKGSLFVSCTKSQPDLFFNFKRKLTILSESGEKQVASFHCEPSGELLFELISCSSSSLLISRPFKALGSTSISLQDVLAPSSKLSMEKWLDLVPSSGMSCNPIRLRIALSVTIPAKALYELRLVRSRPISISSCFPLPGRVQSAKSWTCVIDGSSNEVISIQMREKNGRESGMQGSTSRKEVIGITELGHTITLAEFVEDGWSMMSSCWSLKPRPKSTDGHIFDLIGSRVVKLFRGRKLEFEHRYCEVQRNEHDFISAVEFSAVDPYGKAVALIDLKFGLLKVKEEWFVVPGIVVAFVLSDVQRKEGLKGIFYGAKNKVVNSEERLRTNQIPPPIIEVGLKADNAVMPDKSKYQNEVKSGGCGGCGATCGEFGNTNAGGCGGCGGCGGGCGSGRGSSNQVRSGGCGGCGGGCGGGGCSNQVKSGGFGGCGGGSCGNMVNIGGGGCGGGCNGTCSGCGGCGISSI